MNTTTIKIRRTVNGGPPDDLEPGELSAEMTIPPKLWLGVSAAVHADERLLLVGDPALPAGGAQYDVLSKASAADHDVGWARMVRIGGDTITGPLAINRVWVTGDAPPLVINKDADPPTATTVDEHIGLRLLGRMAPIRGPYLVLESGGGLGMLLFRGNSTAYPINTAPLGTIQFSSGFNDPAMSAANAGARITVAADENWSATAKGTRLSFFTREIGDTQLREQLQIASGVTVFDFMSPPAAPGGGMQRGDLNAKRVFVNGEPVAPLPSGGGQYDVLSKTSATAGDPPTWAGAGQRPNNNTVIGSGAFNLTATGSNNVAIGLNSLVSAVSGSNNIAIGNTAANANNSAGNIAIGGQAFSLSPLGGNNIAIGYQAMQLANLPAGGNSNIAIGTWALRSLAGVSGDNVVLGGSAAAGLTGGTRNICIGNGAGWYFGAGLSDPLTSAVQSIFIGAFAKPRADNAVNEIVIGSGTGSTSAALGNGSNTITLGNDQITALYTRAGLVLGDDPTGGALGPGSVNVTDGYYINGQELKAEATVAATAPSSPTAGDLWFDSVNNQLKTYNGTTWIAAGTPTGGAQYDVLSKASATAGDVEWRGAGERPNNNTVIGAGAFNLTATGTGNVVMGQGALGGAAAGGGNGNVAIGQNALRNSTAFFKVAIGQQTLSANTSGGDVAVGRQALALNTTGAGNVAVGTQALAYNLIGEWNTGVGSLALVQCTGSNNTGVGASALTALQNSSRNTSVGQMSLGNLTIGNDNIAIGFEAALSTGITGVDRSDSSIYIGNETGPANASQTNQIVIGHAVKGNGSNTITLGNDAVTALYTSADIYVRNHKIGGFAPSIAWTAETDPNGVSMFVNNTGRVLNIAAISGIVEEENGSAATVTVVKAASGTALAAGTPVHGAPFDADLNAGSTQDITPFVGMTLEIGERLGLQADAVVAWRDSVASITVYLEP